jgi:polar amino acid transport system substrate-binding protein
MISNLFTRVPADDSVQNIKKLYAGRIDLYIDDEAVIKNILEKEFSRKNSSLIITKNSYMEKNLYLALSLKNEKAQSFIKDFNEGLYEIKKNGKYKKILLRYGLNK